MHQKPRNNHDEQHERKTPPRRTRPGTRDVLLRGLSKSTYNSLAQEAASLDLSVSWLIRHVLDEYVTEHKSV